MLPLISTMSTPASMTIETAPTVILALVALFVCASLGVLGAALVARKRARREAAEHALLTRVAARVSESTDVTHRPLAA